MTIEANAAPKGRDATRERILATALELFAAQGFDATTVRQISQRVGLTDAALYHYFKSKRDILTSLWKAPFDEYTNAGAAGPLTHEILDDVTARAVRFSVANDYLIRLTTRETLGGDQTAKALRLQNRAALRRTLHEHFATLFEAAEADIRAEAVLALIMGTTMRGQMEFGAAYAAAAGSGAFLERTLRWARSLARLEEAG